MTLAPPSADAVAWLYLLLVLPCVPATMAALQRRRRRKVAPTVELRRPVRPSATRETVASQTAAIKDQVVPAFQSAEDAGVATAVRRHRKKAEGQE